jgi:hypothetical protein
MCRYLMLLYPWQCVRCKRLAYLRCSVLKKLICDTYLHIILIIITMDKFVICSIDNYASVSQSQKIK